MMARDRTPQHPASSDGDQRPPPNIHSRGTAREQLRQQQPQPGGSGVLADLHTLHGQRNRDIHAVFVSTPRDSVAASAYVSGHLTPTDQWVAISSSGSGVISLTSSDNEDEGRSHKGKKDSAPASRIVDPQPPRRRGYFSTIPVAAPVPASSALPSVPGSSRSDAEQQAVHLLRESVASLLSSAGSAASSTVSSAQPQSLTATAAPASNRGAGWRRRSQSPSNVSKISEPCYATSAPRRQFTTDFDHFSDVALSAVAATAPPSHQRGKQSEPHRPAALLPTYDEFKHRGASQPPLHEEFKHCEADQSPLLHDADIADVYMPPTIPPSGSRQRMPTGSPPFSALPVAAESQDSSATSLRRRAAGSAGMSGSSAAATTVVASRAVPDPAAYHPLLADLGSPRAPHDQLSIYSASRSPFASIRTVSPIIVAEGSSILRSAAAIDHGAVARAYAEAALERTILCPMSCTADASYFASDKKSDAGYPKSSPDGPNHPRQTWAKYTGYAIVGFGVGTLVGMMCCDMITSAAATPKATRTIPLTGF